MCQDPPPRTTPLHSAVPISNLTTPVLSISFVLPPPLSSEARMGRCDDALMWERGEMRCCIDTVSCVEKVAAERCAECGEFSHLVCAFIGQIQPSRHFLFLDEMHETLAVSASHRQALWTGMLHAWLHNCIPRRRFSPKNSPPFPHFVKSRRAPSLLAASESKMTADRWQVADGRCRVAPYMVFSAILAARVQPRQDGTKPKPPTHRTFGEG